jgi:hypothetical protein
VSKVQIFVKKDSPWTDVIDWWLYAGPKLCTFFYQRSRLKHRATYQGSCLIIADTIKCYSAVNKINDLTSLRWNWNNAMPRFGWESKIGNFVRITWLVNNTWYSFIQWGARIRSGLVDCRHWLTREYVLVSVLGHVGPSNLCRMRPLPTADQLKYNWWRPSDLQRYNV